MNELYRGSWLKIQRAKEHIENLNAILERFLDSDFYRISIEQDLDGANFIKFDIDTSEFPRDSCALIIGDALHNLRSALDLFYAANVLILDDWTSFPISDTGKKLEGRLEKALKKQKISKAFSKYILDPVKPYETGNFYLWALHHLNILDKHQLLIPVIQHVQFFNVCLEDDKNIIVNRNSFYFTSETGRVRLDGTEGRKVTLKDKGRATVHIVFTFGSSIQGQLVLPTLNWITEEVTRTIKLFDLRIANGGT